MDKNNQRKQIKVDNTKSEYTSQSEAILQMCMGNNVFLSGPAGSGKSYVIKEYCRLLREGNYKVRVFKTSTTGLSALNIGGQTIQAYSGQGFSKKSFDELNEQAQSKTSDNKGLWFKSQSEIMETDVLIIDEISMYSEASLEFLYDRIVNCRGSIDKIQIIVAGDFSQLPPVATDEDVKHFVNKLKNYCYVNPVWNNFHFIPCFLDRIYRAKDTRLQFILNEIANGRGLDGEVEPILNTITTQKKSYEPGVPILLSTNAQVKKINDSWHARNKGNEYFYRTKYDPDCDLKLAHRLAAENDSENELSLKVGDTIMINCNDTSSEDERFGDPINGGPTLKNGMVGIFVGLSGINKSVAKKQTKPEELVGDRQIGFQYKNYGKTYLYLIEPYHKQFLDTNDKPIAGFTQYPIKLAYAISIHKSQGQTFSKIAIDLRKCWMPGLGYVALSRATNISGIHLLNPDGWGSNWNRNALKIDKTSMYIKRDLLKKSKKVRKIYKKAYIVVGYDVSFFIRHRKNLSLKQMLIKQYNKMQEDNAKELKLIPKKQVK